MAEDKKSYWQRHVDKQAERGRSRRTRWWTDEEWEAADKLVTKMRKRRKR